ncbi:hypothetical protein [uncultured Dialister sp.]|uniref:hypothetical protein n=1 Tax=uncultured Dialister sp. TaxID=278064 RepID=UPI0027DE1C86|nr:hypothetical protein [uncultured Dialister sp.]
MNSQSLNSLSPRTMALGILKAAWGNKLTDEQAKLYLLMTNDIPEPVLLKSIEALIKESRFLPSVAEIRERAAALYNSAQGKEPPDAGRGWGEVVREISRTGYYGKPQIRDPVAAEVVRRMGWKEICSAPADETGVLRGQFLKIYAMLQESRREEHNNRALLQDGKVRGFIASVSGKLAPGKGRRKVDENERKD